MREPVSTVAERYARKPGVAAQVIRELREGQDERFLDALDAVRDTADPAARERLLRLLLVDDRALVRLTRPGFLNLVQVIDIARQIQAVDPVVDARLLRLLLAGSQPVILDPWHASRILEIVATISDGSRIRPLLPLLLRSPDTRIRSKAVLLLGRFSQNLSWLAQRLAERDPRVRANAVESMWGLDSWEARELFLVAAEDSNQRVAANAAVGLYRAGDLEATRIVRRMAQRGDSNLRASALWAMGESQDPRFLPLLADTVSRRMNGLVHQNAIRSTVRIRSRLARLRQREPLRVHAAASGDRLDVWVYSPAGEPMIWLPPTAFVARGPEGALDIRSVRHVIDAEAPAGERYEVTLQERPPANLLVGVYTDELMGEREVG
jgi:hypothetical protein